MTCRDASSRESLNSLLAGETVQFCERQAFVNLGAPLHFIGISGIGMSALARLLRARGFSVSGCSDVRTELTDRLEEEGIPILFGHSADHLRDGVTLVVSSAIDAHTSELREAERRGIPVIRRGSLLAALLSGADGAQEIRSLAVAGTHGKTTTTAMLGTILDEAGEEPTVVLGGEFVGGLCAGSNTRNGTGTWFVAESDESDGSFLELRPSVAVVTNVENDHVTSDEELKSLMTAFERFLAGVGEVAIIGVDEPRSLTLAELPRAARTVTFGFAAQADVRATSVFYRGFGSTFDVVAHGAPMGTVSLSVPGAINIQNSLGAVAAGLEIGLPFAGIAQALSRFQGVRRRFEILAQGERFTVVDDYAHHPTAVEATLAAARAAWDGPIVVAFQPHRYSRTRYLAREFALALRGADRVILTPIYEASEAPLPGVDATLIGEPLRGFGTEVAYVDSVERLVDEIRGSAPRGSLVLLLGAGTITSAAHRLAQHAQELPLQARAER